MPNRHEGGSSPLKEKLYKSYMSSNKRYKNKVKKAKKRYGNCKPEILQKIIDKLTKHRKSYKKVN